MHQYKGLENDCVILASDFIEVMHEGQATEFDRLSDSMNLIYVAVTRAKKTLIINKDLGELMARIWRPPFLQLRLWTPTSTPAPALGHTSKADPADRGASEAAACLSAQGNEGSDSMDLAKPDGEAEPTLPSPSPSPSPRPRSPAAPMAAAMPQSPAEVFAQLDNPRCDACALPLLPPDQPSMMNPGTEDSKKPTFVAVPVSHWSITNEFWRRQRGLETRLPFENMSDARSRVCSTGIVCHQCMAGSSSITGLPDAAEWAHMWGSTLPLSEATAATAEKAR